MSDEITKLAEAVLIAYKEATKNKKTWWNAADYAANEIGFDTRGTTPVYLLLKSESIRKETVLWAKSILEGKNES